MRDEELTPQRSTTKKKDFPSKVDLETQLLERASHH
jgi:hypothetical protein